MCVYRLDVCVCVCVCEGGEAGGGVALFTQQTCEARERVGRVGSGGTWDGVWRVLDGVLAV